MSSKPCELQIDEDLLLEFSGQKRLDDVRDIVLRDLGIQSVEGLDIDVPNLQSISLAHNRVTCLDWRVPKISLTELNISHNQVCASNSPALSSNFSF